MSVEPLTAREEQVLRLVVAGLCNKAIGRQLGIAVGTVKSHLKSAFEKLDVQSRTQAAAAVERRGLLRHAGTPGLSKVA
jgi:DNA-binding NarL/FixJ family response regulator